VLALLQAVEVLCQADTAIARALVEKKPHRHFTLIHDVEGVDDIDEPKAVLATNSSSPTSPPL